MKNDISGAGTAPTAGALLREWRGARRLSQLDLALQADISARHLSYVENGRARPSREMIVRLCAALAVPLRERNVVLVAGGFAPQYQETGLDTPRLAQMRHAIEAMLAQQEPYPAFLLDRHWNILMQNEAAACVNRYMLGGRDSRHANMLHQIFDPADLRGALENWEEIAGDLLCHLHSEVAAARPDAAAAALLREILAYPGVPVHWRQRDLGNNPAPVLSACFRRGDTRISFFSTITTFGTPRDLTLEELHVESCFPMDAATEAFCRALRASR